MIFFSLLETLCSKVLKLITSLDNLPSGLGTISPDKEIIELLEFIFFLDCLNIAFLSPLDKYSPPLVVPELHIGSLPIVFLAPPNIDFLIAPFENYFFESALAQPDTISPPIFPTGNAPAIFDAANNPATTAILFYIPPFC